MSAATKSAYTPGPWEVFQEECDKPYIRIRGTLLGRRFKIANVLTPVYDGVHQCEADETRANARLIAAAPDMAEALRELLDCTITEWPAVAEKACAVLAKAGAK